MTEDTATCLFPLHRHSDNSDHFCATELRCSPQTLGLIAVIVFHLASERGAGRQGQAAGSGFRFARSPVKGLLGKQETIWVGRFFEGTPFWLVSKGNQKENHHVGGSNKKHPHMGLSGDDLPMICFGGLQSLREPSGAFGSRARDNHIAKGAWVKVIATTAPMPKSLALLMEQAPSPALRIPENY